jgi:hypothetical protein
MIPGSDAPPAGVTTTHSLRRSATVIAVVAIAVSCVGPTTAEPLRAKARHGRIWHGYGFLPGYRPPEQIEWELNHRTRNWYGAPIYWYGYPGFYRGRWNGGGFGPCWTPTPIGPSWNCG